MAGIDRFFSRWGERGLILAAAIAHEYHLVNGQALYQMGRSLDDIKFHEALDFYYFLLMKDRDAKQRRELDRKIRAAAGDDSVIDEGQRADLDAFEKLVDGMRPEEGEKSEAAPTDPSIIE